MNSFSPFLIRLALVCLPWCCVSCALTDSATKIPVYEQAHREFTERADYPKTIEVYRNETLLKSEDATQKRVKIDLSDQRVQMLVGDAVVVDSPCCTGKAGKRTPTGTFPVKEKIKDKRSNIFGSLYRSGRKVYGGDRRKYGGSYDRYVGSSLPYWMRLTDDGIGIHASKYVHRYPGSNGCVRMPHGAVSTIFAMVDAGTPVDVVP